MKLGLVGKSLSHSFSKNYFEKKFKREGLGNYEYLNFELTSIENFPELIRRERPDGLNVTIPYKTAVIPFLDQLTQEASAIGAVNTIAVKDGKTIGHNTDWIGFKQSLEKVLPKGAGSAIILGTGGASKAVAYALDQLNIDYRLVSRTRGQGQINYAEAASVIPDVQLVINTTPLGTSPNTSELPPLSLANVSENHLFYDLVYNPSKTRLLAKAEEKGAAIKNGYEMLELQAEEAWDFWHKNTLKS